MEDRPESNTELRTPDIFSVVNNYYLLLFCASCILSSLYVQQLFLYLGMYEAGIGVSSVVAIILPVYLLLRRVGPGFARQVRLSVPQAPMVVYVVAATLATVVIVDHIYLITQQFNPVPHEYIESLEDLRPKTGWDFVVVFAGLCVLVPVAEETVFRGMIQQIFARNMGGVFGFVLAGALFGAVHLNPHLLISIAFFGIFLGFVYYATGNLIYTIAAHSLFNIVALVQLTLSGATESTDLPFYLRDIRIFVIAVVLLVFFLFKIKRGGPDVEPPHPNEM